MSFSLKNVISIKDFSKEDINFILKQAQNMAFTCARWTSFFTRSWIASSERRGDIMSKIVKALEKAEEAQRSAEGNG